MSFGSGGSERPAAAEWGIVCLSYCGNGKKPEREGEIRLVLYMSGLELGIGVQCRQT